MREDNTERCQAQEGMSEAQKEEKTASASVNFIGVHDTVLKTPSFCDACITMNSVLALPLLAFV